MVISVTCMDVTLSCKLLLELMLISNNGVSSYEFRLKCPQKCLLKNPCTNVDASMKIPECFELDGVILIVDSEPTIEYQNLEIHESPINNIGSKKNGYYIIDLELSTETIDNTLCVTSLNIPVKFAKENNLCKELNGCMGELVHVDKE